MRCDGATAAERREALLRALDSWTPNATELSIRANGYDVLGRWQLKV
jgi:hypothetical protein